MRYDARQELFFLNTGRSFFAQRGVLGLSAQTITRRFTATRDVEGVQDYTLFEGAHSSVGYLSDEQEVETLTKNERREIADYMMNLWNEWADRRLP